MVAIPTYMVKKERVDEKKMKHLVESNSSISGLGKKARVKAKKNELQDLLMFGRC